MQMETTPLGGSASMRIERRWRDYCFLGLLIAGLSLGYPAEAKSDESQQSVHSAESLPVEAGLGVASFLATIPYGAAKIGYAVTGAVAGGLEYAWSGGQRQPAQDIWNSAMGGTYILTPDHLRGKKPIKFLGDTPESEPSATPIESPMEPPRP